MNQKQTTDKEDKIPMIVNNIETVTDCDKYTIGKTQNKYVLMYEINFRKAKNSFSNHISFINFLISNNSKPFHLFFQGVYFDKISSRHFLIFDYPDYQLITASRSSVFNRVEVIQSFIGFLSEMTSEDITNLMLVEDLIFFNFNKELRIVHFGNLDQICLPCFKSQWRIKIQRRKEKRDDGLIDHLIKFIYNLCYAKRENEIDTDTILNSTINELKLWNYQSDLSSEIVSVIDMIYKLLKTKIDDNAIFNLIINNLALNESKNKQNGKEKEDFESQFEQEEKVKFVLIHKAFITLVNFNKDIECHKSDLTSENKSKQNEYRAKGLLIMNKYFPVKENNIRKTVYSTEVTDYFRKDCLTPAQIPEAKPQNKKKSNGLTKVIGNLNQTQPSSLRNSNALKLILKKDNWLKFRYYTNYPGIFRYRLSYSTNQLSSAMIIRYLERSRLLWPKDSKHPFHEDTVLKFLSICNYDIYKALFGIVYLHPVFINFLSKEYHFN